MNIVVYVCVENSLLPVCPLVMSIWGSPWVSSGNRLGQTHSHSPCTSQASEHAHQAIPTSCDMSCESCDV